MPKKFAVIVAGGSGNRMKTTTPKQFLPIAGKPVLMHTLRAFHRFNSAIEIILVLPKNQVKTWESLCRKHNFTIPFTLAYGGSTRFESVKNGLNLVAENSIVFIHDGVRPLVSEQTLANCLKTTTEKGNALPVIPVSESVRFIDNNGNKALDRSKYFLVQTPQTFRSNEIKKAYQQAYSPLFSDDASVLENTGASIHTVLGNRENIKITFPEDIRFAEVLLNA